MPNNLISIDIQNADVPAVLSGTSVYYSHDFPFGDEQDFADDIIVRFKEEFSTDKMINADDDSICKVLEKVCNDYKEYAKKNAFDLELNCSTEHTCDMEVILERL